MVVGFSNSHGAWQKFYGKTGAGVPSCPECVDLIDSLATAATEEDNLLEMVLYLKVSQVLEKGQILLPIKTNYVKKLEIEKSKKIYFKYF